MATTCAQSYQPIIPPTRPAGKPPRWSAIASPPLPPKQNSTMTSTPILWHRSKSERKSASKMRRPSYGRRSASSWPSGNSALTASNLQAGVSFGETGASYVPSEPLLPQILKEVRKRHLATRMPTEPLHIQQLIARHPIPPRDVAIANAEPPIASIFNNHIHFMSCSLYASPALISPLPLSFIAVFMQPIAFILNSDRLLCLFFVCRLFASPFCESLWGDVVTRLAARAPPC